MKKNQEDQQEFGSFSKKTNDCYVYQNTIIMAGNMGEKQQEWKN